jgi:hypothetical protein
MLLLVASVLSWRHKVYFAGSLDPVVVVKAGLGGLALALALHARLRAPRISSLHGGTVMLTSVYLVTTVVGAWAGGNPVASAVVAVRVGMVMMTVGLLLTTYRPEQVVRSVVGAFAVAGTLAVVTGLPGVDKGRLVGGVPPLTANELALLFGLVGLYLLWFVATQRATPWHWPAALFCFALVFLTGSRTALFMLVVAVFVVLAQMRVYPRPTFAGLVLSVPVLAYAALGTDVIRLVLERGGAENVMTLSSRTIAWDAALSMESPWWTTWFGGGLAVKAIPVAGQYWKTQILDSSWVSALVQGGWVGVTVVAVWTLAIGVAVLRSPRAWRPLLTGLYVFLIGRSPLESGLFDATAAFIALVTIAFASHLVDGSEEPTRSARSGRGTLGATAGVRPRPPYASGRVSAAPEAAGPGRDPSPSDPRPP